MAIFECNVQRIPSDNDILFSPTVCKLQPEDVYEIDVPTDPEDPESPTTKEQVFDAVIWLYQYIPDGEIIYRRRRTFPASVRAAVATIDPITLKPQINWQALAPLFESFGLEVV